MNPRLVTILAMASALLVGCDDSASLCYSTRAEAEADRPFARGWLPRIIPASSREITMKNDLDLNLSNGTFRFVPSDHDAFVAHLTRTPENDRDGSEAYAYKDWTFWIRPDRSGCGFRMRPCRGEKPGGPTGGGNGGQRR
ncbi:MAG: hypothetical protein J0M04_20560 [Verrucomicrobia bacterium]|nr:hypothetical protein [Verrucomicrobiota bacterium]